MATKQFYFICLIFLTFLGGCFLLLLKRKLSNNQDSKGILFVALGLFSFATIGFYKLFDPPIPKLLLSDIDRIFSVFTNIFFVAALPFFSSAFIKFRNYVSIFRKKEQWVNSVFIFFAFLAALFSVIERNVESEFGKNLIISIDSIFSTTTIGLVTYALFKSISKIWEDTLSKFFIGLFLILFPISQLLIPITAIFPAQFNFLYFSFLIVLLIGLAFFIFVAIAYYSLTDNETKTHHKEDANYSENNIHINALKLGYDSIEKVYFIEFELLKDKRKFVERVANRKILLPFSNWILFSIAKKLNVKLNNQDIALTKFRMVEYWNKDSDTKLNQDILFINDMGSFEFNFEDIEIVDLNKLESKLIITESIQKSIENFAFLFPEKNKSKITSSEVISLLNKSNTSSY